MPIEHRNDNIIKRIKPRSTLCHEKAIKAIVNRLINNNKNHVKLKKIIPVEIG